MKIITITYQDSGEQRTIRYDGVKWECEDANLADLLNHDFTGFIGHSGYYPHPWFKAKAVADELGGTVDQPKLKVESKPGRIY